MSGMTHTLYKMISANAQSRCSAFPTYFPLATCDIMTSADIAGAAGEHGLVDPDAAGRPHQATGMRPVPTALPQKDGMPSDPIRATTGVAPNERIGSVATCAASCNAAVAYISRRRSTLTVLNIRAHSSHCDECARMLSTHRVQAEPEI